jgi:predicted nucleotidyltransferase
MNSSVELSLETLQTLLKQQEGVFRQRYRITEIGIFGSYARGEQTATSDVDVLVDYEQAPPLSKLLELREYLSDLVGVPVDVVTKKGLKPRIREQVLAEVVYV